MSLLIPFQLWLLVLTAALMLAAWEAVSIASAVTRAAFWLASFGMSKEAKRTFRIVILDHLQARIFDDLKRKSRVQVGVWGIVRAMNLLLTAFSHRALFSGLAQIGDVPELSEKLADKETRQGAKAASHPLMNSALWPFFARVMAEQVVIMSLNSVLSFAIGHFVLKPVLPLHGWLGVTAEMATLLPFWALSLWVCRSRIDSRFETFFTRRSV